MTPGVDSVEEVATMEGNGRRKRNAKTIKLSTTHVYYLREEVTEVIVS